MQLDLVMKTGALRMQKYQKAVIKSDVSYEMGGWLLLHRICRLKHYR